MITLNENSRHNKFRRGIAKKRRKGSSESLISSHIILDNIDLLSKKRDVSVLRKEKYILIKNNRSSL